MQHFLYELTQCQFSDKSLFCLEVVTMVSIPEYTSIPVVQLMQPWAWFTQLHCSPLLISLGSTLKPQLKDTNFHLHTQIPLCMGKTYRRKTELFVIELILSNNMLLDSSTGNFKKFISNKKMCHFVLKSKECVSGFSNYICPFHSLPIVPIPLLIYFNNLATFLYSTQKNKLHKHSTEL